MSCTDVYIVCIVCGSGERKGKSHKSKISTYHSVVRHSIFIGDALLKEGKEVVVRKRNRNTSAHHQIDEGKTVQLGPNKVHDTVEHGNREVHDACLEAKKGEDTYKKGKTNRE